MNQLEIRAPQSVIIFIDGSKKFVPTSQAEQIFKLSSTAQKTFILSGGMYNFSSISKILTENEFYQEYPEERPSISTYSELPNYESLEQRIYKYPEERRFEAISGMIKGLKQFIDEGGGEVSTQTLQMLDRWEKILLELN